MRLKQTPRIAIGLALALSLYASAVFAAQPPGATTAPYTIAYSGKLATAGGTAVTTTQSIRFSIWTDDDVDATDFLGSGAINPAATGFTGWEETHTVTPDASGIFHVQLGDTVTLPNFTDSTDKYLQVDVKAVALPDTSYETLDPDGDTSNTTDRHPVNSAAFAINADTVDNADVGTDPGNLVVLNALSEFPTSTIPGGTDEDTFIIDANDSVSSPGTIQLQFGSTLAKVLEYDLLNGWFNFNDSVNIQGGLTASGNVDFSSASEFHMREVADHTTADCTTVGELILDTTENRIYACTAAGSPGTWAATSSTASSYAQSIVIEPEYEDGVIQGDGSSNNGKLAVYFADTDGSPGNANINYYEWTTRQGSLQDMDLVLRVDLPDGFTSFQATPVEVTYRTSDLVTANNKVDVSIEDTTGTTVPLIGASGLVSTTFATAAITFGGAPTFTAGEPITIKVKLSALSGGFADVGKISINYNGL